MRVAALAAPLILVVLPALALGESRPPKIAILPLAAKKLDKETVTILDDLLVAGVDRLGRFEVISTDDVKSVLGFEKLKDAVGCDSAQCAADIGGALGADLLLTGSASKLGAEMIVTLSLIAVQEARVVGRAQRRVKNDESLYVQAVDTAITEVVVKLMPAADPSVAKPEAPAPAPAPPPAAAEANSTPVALPDPTVTAAPESDSRRLWGFLALGVAGIAAGTSAALFLRAPSEAEIRKNEYQAFLDAPDGMAAAEAYIEVEDARERHNKLTLASWCVAGAAVLAGGVATWAFLTAPTGPTLQVTPAPGGAALVFTGGF